MRNYGFNDYCIQFKRFDLITDKNHQDMNKAMEFLDVVDVKLLQSKSKVSAMVFFLQKRDDASENKPIKEVEPTETKITHTDLRLFLESKGWLFAYEVIDGLVPSYRQRFRHGVVFLEIPCGKTGEDYSKIMNGAIHDILQVYKITKKELIEQIASLKINQK